MNRPFVVSDGDDGQQQRSVAYSASSLVAPRPLMAGHQVYDRPHPPIERRPDHYLLHLVCAGSGQVWSAERGRMAVPTGTWFCCFPGQRLRYWCDEEPWTYRWVGFDGRDGARFLAQAGVAHDTLCLPSSDPTAAMALCAKLQDRLQTTTCVGQLAAQGALLDLLAHLVGQAEPSQRSLATTAADEDGLAVAIRCACQFMVRHFAEGIAVADVIRQVGYERSYFSAAFSSRTGGSLQAYLNDLRMQRAEELLRGSDLEIAAIAASVGYGSEKGFSRAFGQRHGRSPGRWRRGHQSGAV